MNKIYNHRDFYKANTEFEEAKNDEFTDCSVRSAWTKFIPIHKDISKERCPICEQKLDENNERHTGSSIDHFRPKRNEANTKQPKDVYAFLECEESNYILMCKGCNDGYKKSFFPLDTDVVATKLSELSDEKPLLLNVREEDPLDYFELVFTERYLPLAILELKIKKFLRDNPTSYEYRKAEETIRFFRLGACHENEPKISKKGLYKNFECRVFTLAEHHESLIELAKAINEEKDFEKLLEENPKLKEYGFFRFLINGQFSIEQ